MLGSARFNQALPWLALTILAALCALVYAHARETPKASAAPCTKPSELTPEGKKGAQKVAKRFIINAVLRVDPGRAWTDASPSLRGGATRAEWATGTIPVDSLPPTTRPRDGKLLQQRPGRIAMRFPLSVEDRLLVYDLVLVRWCAEAGWRVRVLSPVAVRVGGAGTPALP